MTSSAFVCRCLQWGKGDVRDFPRPMGKMITQATKVKKVLSANAEIPVNLNSLHDEVDYSSTVSRTSFEAASKDLFDRVTGPIDQALEQAGMKLADIQEVEVIGGASRIPKVRTYLLSRKLRVSSVGAHLKSMSMHASLTCSGCFYVVWINRLHEHDAPSD